MNFDAFISYRRNNGFMIAQVINDQLAKRGINCFLDMEVLSSGKFDVKILSAIAEAPNFILILSEGALDKCSDEDDWVRSEILEAVNLEAVKLNKTIIPILYV